MRTIRFVNATTSPALFEVEMSAGGIMLTVNALEAAAPIEEEDGSCREVADLQTMADNLPLAPNESLDAAPDNHDIVGWPGPTSLMPFLTHKVIGFDYDVALSESRLPDDPVAYIVLSRQYENLQ
jgi:hypothetical protein